MEVICAYDLHEGDDEEMDSCYCDVRRVVLFVVDSSCSSEDGRFPPDARGCATIRLSPC